MAPLVLAIKAENLRVKYTSGDYVIWAVRGVDLEVSTSEALCIVGESGCGKSTVASAIAGALPPYSVTEGKLWIFEHLVIDGARHEYNGVRGKIVNLIPQNPGTSLNPYMTVEEHFYYVLRDVVGLGKKEIRKLAIENLRKVGLDNGVLDKYPHELSVGMQQRTIIALALASGARILVADEPTSSVDASLKAQVLGLLEKLREEYKLTMVIVTHDILSTVRVCNRIAVMYAGKVVELGPVESILRQPRHPYTKMLIDSAPILGIKKPLKPLPGEPPSLTQDFTWCPFKERCPIKAALCENEPPMIRVSVEIPHLVRCWKSVGNRSEQ